jgi:hypothetical protein
MKQAISGAVTNRKGAVKLRVKTPLKIDPKARAKNHPKVGHVQAKYSVKPPPGGEAPSRRSDSILCSSLSDPYASEASSPFPNNHSFNLEQFLKFLYYS